MINAASFQMHSAMALVVEGLLAGLLAGVVHFVSLRWNVRFFACGGAANAFVLQLVRLASTAAIFVLLAKAGAFALLAGIAGFIWARTIALELQRVST